MKKNPNGFDPQRKKSYPKSIEENINQVLQPLFSG